MDLGYGSEMDDVLVLDLNRTIILHVIKMRGRVVCSPVWPPSRHVAEDGLELF